MKTLFFTLLISAALLIPETVLATTLPEYSRFQNTETQNGQSYSYDVYLMTETVDKRDKGFIVHFTKGSKSYPGKTRHHIFFKELYLLEWNKRDVFALHLFKNSKNNTTTNNSICSIALFPFENPLEGFSEGEFSKIRLTINNESLSVDAQYIHSDKEVSKGAAWKLSSGCASQQDRSAFSELSTKTGEGLNRLLELFDKHSDAGEFTIEWVGDSITYDTYQSLGLLKLQRELIESETPLTRDVVWLHENPRVLDGQSPERSAPPAMSTPISTPSFHQINQDYGCNGDQSFSKMEDNTFTWIGKIVAVTPNTIDVNFTDNSNKVDVTLTLRDHNAGLYLNKGQRIKTTFTLSEQGSCSTPFKGNSADIL